MEKQKDAYRMSRDNYVVPLFHNSQAVPGLARFCLHCPILREVSIESSTFWRLLYIHYTAEADRWLPELRTEFSRCRGCFTKFREIGFERVRGRPRKGNVSTKEKPLFPIGLPSFAEWPTAQYVRAPDHLSFFMKGQGQVMDVVPKIPTSQESQCLPRAQEPSLVPPKVFAVVPRPHQTALLSFDAFCDLYRQ